MALPPSAKRNRAEGDNRTLYEILGVPPSADNAELQKRYRRLALEYHPDRNNGREEAAKAVFQKITEAYHTLKDPEKRLQYDSQHNLNFTGRVAALAKRANNARARTTPHPENAETSAAREPATNAPTGQDDDEEEEYSPEYVGHSSSTAAATQDNAVEVSYLPNRRLGVKFVLRRDQPTQPLGLRLDRHTMRVGETVEDTAAFGCGIPIGAVLTHIDGQPVACPEDVVALAQGRLTVTATVSSDVQRVALRRGSLWDPSSVVWTTAAAASSEDASTVAFPLNEMGALCKLVVSGADGCCRLAAAGATESLTALGGGWVNLRGRRVLAVGDQAITAPVVWDDAPQLADHADLRVLRASVPVTPASIYRQRHFVDVLVLCDETLHHLL